jgi:hypothetical protein
MWLNDYRYHLSCYQFFNQCLDNVALLLLATSTSALTMWIGAFLPFCTLKRYTLNYMNAYRVFNVNCHFISQFKLWMKNYRIGYGTLRDWTQSVNYALPQSNSILPTPPLDCVSKQRDVELLTLQPDQRLRETVTLPCSWQHCPATHPKSVTYNLPVYKWHENVRKCGKINLSVS